MTTLQWSPTYAMWAGTEMEHGPGSVWEMETLWLVSGMAILLIASVSHNYFSAYDRKV